MAAASKSDLQAALGVDTLPHPSPSSHGREATAPHPVRARPRRHHRAFPRRTAPAVRWQQTPAPLRRWVRSSQSTAPDQQPSSKFAKYDVQVPVPTYDSATYEAHLSRADWTKEETDYLMGLYRDCYGKWPVIHDEYTFNSERTMEDLKSRFYNVSATLLALKTPITSMTAPEYDMYQTLVNFDAPKEASRKKLVEGHLKRPRNEVDEETVLLGELQRIMLNQNSLDADREDLRRRLDHPQANTNGYEYSSYNSLNILWQQLLAADRLRKNQRLRSTATARDSLSGPTESAGPPRPSRESAPSASAAASAPQTGLDLSKADQLRFGVVYSSEKLSSGVTFASDKLSKPRIAKSTLQSQKIADVLAHIGVPELIPLPTPPVIKQFEAIIAKVLTLLDMRKVGEREEHELKVRQAELTS